MFHQNIRIYVFKTCGVGRWFACLPVYKTEDCIDHRGFYFRRCSHWIPSGLNILIIQIITFFILFLDLAKIICILKRLLRPNLGLLFVNRFGSFSEKLLSFSV